MLIWPLFRFLGRNLWWFFGKFKKSKRHSEINWPLPWQDWLEPNSIGVSYFLCDWKHEIALPRMRFRGKYWNLLFQLKSTALLEAHGRTSCYFMSGPEIVYFSPTVLQPMSHPLHKCQKFLTILWSTVFDSFECHSTILIRQMVLKCRVK